MHILILGANGMLGRALVRAFAPDDVTAWEREHLDITDEHAVLEAVPMLRPDVVVNAAAYTDVDRAETEPDEAHNVNGYAVGNLAVACAEVRIPLLHVSTDYVFNGLTPGGYGEGDEPVDPVNVYGRSKLLGETLLRENTRAYWLVRTSGLYGPRGKHFVDTIIRAAQAGHPLTVVSDQHVSPTFTLDLAKAIADLVRARAPWSTYHLVNDGETTWAEFAKAILADAGSKAQVRPVPAADPEVAERYRARRPQWSVLKNTKRPSLRPWRAALREYLALRERLSLSGTDDAGGSHRHSP